MTRKTVFVPYQARTILNRYKRPDHWFWNSYSAHPYVGCQHGCEFCYCREKKYAPVEDIKDFPFRIKVKQNAPDLLRKSLMKVPNGAVAVGDYQPAERKFWLSREMLKICLELGFPAFVLERSPLVLRDLDILQDINARTHAMVVFSIIHTSESPHAGIISQMERLAPPPEERFKAMMKIAQAGIRTGICFMPILPGLCDDPQNLKLVIEKTVEHGGEFVLAAPLTLADQQKEYFFQYLREYHPHLLELYSHLYPQKSYGPVGFAWLNTARRIREICQVCGVSDRMSRPIIEGEKRAMNKRIAWLLADQTYSLELDAASAHRIWSYRKAAWAVEDLEQDISQVYQQLGSKGLQAIPNIGPTIASWIENRFLK